MQSSCVNLHKVIDVARSRLLFVHCSRYVIAAMSETKVDTRHHEAGNVVTEDMSDHTQEKLPVDAAQLRVRPTTGLMSGH